MLSHVAPQSLMVESSIYKYHTSRSDTYGSPRSIGGLRDDALVERLRDTVINIDAALHVRERGLEPVDLSLADGQPPLEKGPVDRLRARWGGERAAPVVVTSLDEGLDEGGREVGRGGLL